MKLVERLRSLCAYRLPDFCHGCVSTDICGEAADEIDRLQMALATALKKIRESVPSEIRINAAHAAWESVVRNWRVEQAGNFWLVANVGRFEGTTDPKGYVDAVAYHRFDTKTQANFYLRNMIVEAVLNAADETV